MNKRQRHYWDACLFLDLINSTPDRHEIVESLADELLGEEAKVQAFTSALTIAEVAFAATEKLGKDINPETLAKIDAFWAPESPWQINELYPAVAYEARGMIREAVILGWSLKAHDAIHFATAKKLGAYVFWTYDDRLYKYDKRFGFAVQAPVSPNLKFSRVPPHSLGNQVETEAQERAAAARAQQPQTGERPAADPR